MEHIIIGVLAALLFASSFYYVLRSRKLERDLEVISHIASHLHDQLERIVNDEQ